MNRKFKSLTMSVLATEYDEYKEKAFKKGISLSKYLKEIIYSSPIEKEEVKYKNKTMKQEHENKRKEMWINAWASIACTNPSLATEFADKALNDFDERFKEPEEIVTKIMEDNDVVQVDNDVQVDKDVLQKKIRSLRFSTRTYNALKNKNILYVGDLLNYTKKELLKFRNLGYLSFSEIEEKLKSLGLNLKDNNLPIVRKPKKKNLSLNIDLEMYDEFKKRATDSGLSLSEYIKTIIPTVQQ